MDHLLATAAVIPPVSETAGATSNAEVIVVGAGIAGASLAAALGRDGKKVLLIERDLGEPDRIVGELLQPGGVQKLRELGLAGCLEGIDSPSIEGYAVFKSRTESVQLRYPIDETINQEARGRSFHHGRFIMKLREAASKSPNVEILQAIVTSLIEDEASESVVGVRVKIKKAKEGENAAQDAEVIREYRAPLTVICDGCASNLRKNLIARPCQTKSHFVGMVLSSCNLPYYKHGHVVLANPAPVLLYPISSTEVRVLVDIPIDQLDAFKKEQQKQEDQKTLDSSQKNIFLPKMHANRFGDFMYYITAPQLPDGIQKAFTTRLQEALTSEKVIQSMPNTFLHPDPFVLRGVHAIGDTLNMRHPLTGGGMTVALNDVVQLRNILRGIKSTNDTLLVSSRLPAFYTKRYPLASTINVLSLALYAVFAATDDPYLPAMREACFNYFQLGGECVNGPMSMLAGLAPSPTKLVFHFFSVAMYAMYKLTCCAGIPTPMSLYRAWRVFWAACRIICPLLS